ncbi:N-myc-interactor isoform X2 [Ambystoma mexicanum]|uniref:N-myc-interactor isoform X2 n=1 Tax=Ambystoma mexicanum TaxID=8296 RepID=UPI0037E85CD3
MSMEELQLLKEELKRWQTDVKQAEDDKTTLLLQKLDVDRLKSTAQNELQKLLVEDTEIDKIHELKKAEYEAQLNLLNEKNSELKKEIMLIQQNIRVVVAKYKGMSEEMKFQQDLPEKKVKFTRMVEDTENGISANENAMNISCQFCIAAKIPFRLEGGQVLITFEEEEVAQNLIKKKRHTVTMDTERVDVKSVPVPLKTALKFEIHVNVSRKDMCVSHLPDNVPEERLRDKLELYFYKSRNGGGEIERVQLDRDAKTATITFLDPGVALQVAKRQKHTLRDSTNFFDVTVAPLIEQSLEKLQRYAGIAKQTILLTDMKRMAEEDEDIQDEIEIFFQKPSNGGGEIQNIKYISNGYATAFFEEEDVKAE